MNKRNRQKKKDKCERNNAILNIHYLLFIKHNIYLFI